MSRTLSARLRSRHLGVMTWSALQAAYPNGGGALAAMPYGTTVTVTDACKCVFDMTPNAARTRWIPANGHAVLCNYGGSLASPIHTWAGATGKLSVPGGDVTIAANLLGAGDRLLLTAILRKRGANATATVNFRLGTTGSYGTDQFVASDSFANYDNRDFNFFADVSITANSFTTTSWAEPTTQNTNAFRDRTTNVNHTATQYQIIDVTSIHASDFVDLVMWRLDWSAQ